MVYTASVAMVALGGSGLLARWSPPATDWWLQVPAVTLPLLGPLALPAALAVGAEWARNRRFGMGLCTVALAAVFTGWALRTSAPPTAVSDQPDRLRVMTLNAGDSAGREGTVADYVERRGPDIVVLQEAGANWGPYAAILKEAGITGAAYAPVAARVASVGGYTVLTDTTAGSVETSRQVTLTRLPVVSHTSGFLGAAEPRAGVYSRTVVRWGGGEVAVYNVHLRAFNPQVGWSWERAIDPDVWIQTPENLRRFFAEQAVEAEALAQMVERETRPVIVAGDFNAAADQWNRAVLTRTLREVTGRWLPGATRPDTTPAVNVDGVLVGSEWAVGEVEIGPAGLSDHRAIFASLALRR